MNFPAQLFPIAWYFVACVPLALLLAWSVRTAPWRRLSDNVQLHVWLGSVVVLALLWSLSAGVRPGLNFHLLGAMVLTLMFGPQLAVIALSLVLAAVTANGAAAWSAYALNALVMVAVPVFAARAIFRLVDGHLPNHFFVYIFLNGFFGAALTVVAAGIAATLLLYAGGAYPGEYLLSQYLPYFLLLGLSEASLSGMCLTLLVVYRPTWVDTFDDRRYLLNK